MDDRLKGIIERIESSLSSEGLERKVVSEKSEHGPADYPSFFEMMVDLKLEGKPEPGAQEVWEQMKAQANYLRAELLYAFSEYRKLENRCRGLEADLLERIKE
jgi:hypothetical protein